MRVHFLVVSQNIFFKLVFYSATRNNLVKKKKKNLVVTIAMLHGEETVHYESLLTRISFLIVCCLNERGKIKIPEKIIYEFPVASPSCGLPLKKQDSLIQKKKNQSKNISGLTFCQFI